MPGKYLSPLCVEELEGDLHKLCFPFAYRTSKGKRITVPKGFVTDYASTGPMSWRYSQSGPWKFAATLHDYLYTLGGCECSRKEADWVLWDAMSTTGIKWRVRVEFYLMVRMFGWMFWKHAEKEAA